MTRWRLVVVTSILLAAGCTSSSFTSNTDAPSTGGPSTESESVPVPASNSKPVEASAAPSRSPRVAPPPRSFTLVATGDVLLHERLWYQAQRDAEISGASDGWDFRPQLASIRPLIRDADVAVCHLETPLAPYGGPYQGYPVFSAPPQIVEDLKWVGFDVCSTASNHVFDQGPGGINRTLGILDDQGLAHSGSARSRKEARTPAMVSIRTSDGRPIRVGFLSYTYGFNGLPYPKGQTWRSNVIDTAEIVAEAKRARRAGADVVVLSMHAGDEYVHEPNEQQRQVARAVANSSQIDLILGHHVHAVQPITKVNGIWVAYGHGNLMAAHRQEWDAKAEGLLTRFTFSERAAGGFAVTSAEYTPLLQTDPIPVSVVDTQRALVEQDYSSAGKQRVGLALSRTRTIVNSEPGPKAGLISSYRPR